MGIQYNNLELFSSNICTYSNLEYINEPNDAMSMHLCGSISFHLIENAVTTMFVRNQLSIYGPQPASS